MIKKKLLAAGFIFMSMLLIFFVYCVLVVKGYISLTSFSQYRFLSGIIYSPLRLDKLGNPTSPQIRIVSYLPCTYYFINGTNTINTDIRLTARTGPMFYFVDYDYNLLFAAAKASVLSDFENRNRSNIIDRSSWLTQIQKRDLEGAIERIVILKIGDLWNAPYHNIYIKLYISGDAILNYVWHDRKELDKNSKWELKRISAHIPLSREVVLNMIDPVRLSVFNKLHTIDTKMFGSSLGVDGMIIKDGEVIKIICQDMGEFVKNDEIRKYWAEVINKSGLLECLGDIVSGQEATVLSKEQIENIIRRLRNFVGGYKRANAMSKRN